MQVVDFARVIENVTAALDGDGVRYALIGGFAMAMRGVGRATFDLDFILMLQDMEKADEIIQSAGYTRAFRNENVSHYMADDAGLGRIDILHAFRGPTLSMLERADRVQVTDGLSLPVVQIEDIVGLKIQALVNDPRRETSDWADIRLLLECCAEQNRPPDWDLISDYLGLFQMTEQLAIMKNWYGPLDPD